MSDQIKSIELQYISTQCVLREIEVKNRKGEQYPLHVFSQMMNKRVTKAR